MKLVGADGGHVEQERWVDDVIVAPSERVLVDVLFDRAEIFTLQHKTPERVYPLVTFDVSEPPSESSASSEFHTLRVNADMVTVREAAALYLARPPDKTLALVAEMDFEDPGSDGPVAYICPMHADVVSESPGACPTCGMKLMPSSASHATHKTGENAHPPAAHGQHDHGEALSDGIEWEDGMVEVNRTTTSENTRWKVIDRDSGKQNADIDWEFTEGDQVKIRLINEMGSDHPMHHPFHIHGERFLVLARDDVPETNAVWKDTVLLRTGEVVDILMDASNPGLWMAHCHIAEHMESGMMFNFRVRSKSA
jgi:FtsP/CotA-like multicopper oxidase with cupredoxin domain